MYPNFSSLARGSMSGFPGIQPGPAVAPTGMAQPPQDPRYVPNYFQNNAANTTAPLTPPGSPPGMPPGGMVRPPMGGPTLAPGPGTVGMPPPMANAQPVGGNPQLQRQMMMANMLRGR